MLRRFIVNTIVLLLLVLSGCNNSWENLIETLPLPTATVMPPMPTSTPEPPPIEESYQGTITIWHSYGDPYINALVQIIVDFQNLYPDVQFDVLYLPENILLERYKSAIQEGAGPVILLGPAEWLLDLSKNRLVADLSPGLETDFKQQIIPNILAGGKVGDTQLGLPFTMEGIVLFRNRILIPDPANTWDELVASCQEVTQVEQIGAYLERGFYYSGAHLEGLGGKLMNPDGTPAFDDEYGRLWIGLLKAFEKIGPTDYLTDLDMKKFMQGQAGYIIDDTTNRQLLAEAIGSQNLAIDPWPAYANGHLAGYYVVRNIYINSGKSDDEKQLAWLFAKFMLSPEAQAHFANAGWIPVAKDVPIEAPLIQQAMHALAGNYPYYGKFHIDLYRTTLDNMLQSIFSGAIEIDEGLLNAKTQIMEAIRNSPP